MKIRFVSALLALALPLVAQEPAASDTNEAMFYKAFYLEKGQRDFAGAMALYEQFLAKAPDHKLASEAARQQYTLLDRTGKTKERDAFKAKYEKLLGNVPLASDADRARPEGGARAEGGRPGGARPDSAARLADLEKQLAKAKADGDAEAVKKLEQQIARTKEASASGGNARRGGGMFSDKKLAEMNDEELTQFKDGVGRMEGMVDRIRQSAGDEQADKLEAELQSLKKSLEANKLDDAQKSLDKIREAMPRRARGGAGGGADARPSGGGDAKPPASGGGGGR